MPLLKIAALLGIPATLRQLENVASLSESDMGSQRFQLPLVWLRSNGS
jgi:hypothetical protein